MKNKIIKINSLATGAAILTIQNGGRKSKPRRFSNIDKAVDYAVAAGNRHSQLYLNGYEAIPYGWVA
jgi:hypothetical protein